jgi:CoA-disulfide reductase
MSKKTLIVGGVAGGASAAARLRRNDENAEIIMFEKGDYISFANCGLPYYIGETIEERDALLVQTPEGMGKRFNIDIRVKNEVIKINKEEKYVEVKNLNTEEIYRESYDKLILSPGSTPLKPPIPGIENSRIFSLWNIPDTDRIKGYVDNNKPESAVVVGGGFIGIEMVENLHDRGLNVSLVEMLDQVMAPVDYEMAQVLHRHITSKNVDLNLNDGVKSFEDKGGKVIVHLQSGKKIETDMVILSIGIKPQSDLAKDAGLEVNSRGGIIVDDRMKTSDDDIYAVGDAIEVEDFNTKEKTMVPLAGPANKQGRIVANVIAGQDDRYYGTQGTSIAKVFDMTVASTGLNEKTLIKSGKEKGKDYQLSIIHSKSHAGYYPGAIPMAIKLIFDLDGKVLGSQIVGYDGVDKRIDVIATSIRFGATVNDLTRLELAYAPPFSSAKDPVNMAGFTAENILNGKIKIVSWDDLEKFDDKDTIILDVREGIERELGYIENSLNIPLDELRDRLDELDKDKNIIVYCAIGLRGYVGARILMQNGFEKVYNFSGGYTTYSCIFCQDDPAMCGGVECQGEVNFNDDGEPEIDVIADTGNKYTLNACGLQCPGPIMQVYKKMEEMVPGDVLEVKATDPGFVNDINAWANKTGNMVLESGKRKKEFYAVLRKGKKKVSTVGRPLPDDKTMVVFSGDFDKAIATFIIANGAAAMGKKVTLFFTFWGLNILRKHEKVSVKKNMLERMFSSMLPRGTRKLKMSNMNMMGMGPKMIRKVMEINNVDSLESLMSQAIDNGVRIVACNMSMDLMGIKQEELIDGVEIGGVASYLESAEDSNVNLFI